MVVASYQELIQSARTGRRPGTLSRGPAPPLRDVVGPPLLALQRRSPHAWDPGRSLHRYTSSTSSHPSTSPTPAFRAPLSLFSAISSLEQRDDGAQPSAAIDRFGPDGGYEEFHPYGTTAWWAGTSEAEVSLKRYRYTGKEKDEETGLYYHGARYYAPWLGRWTSADPIRLRDGVDRYTYSIGNPVCGMDPTGTRTQTAPDMVGYPMDKPIPDDAPDYAQPVDLDTDDQGRATRRTYTPAQYQKLWEKAHHRRMTSEEAATLEELGCVGVAMIERYSSNAGGQRALWREYPNYNTLEGAVAAADALSAAFGKNSGKRAFVVGFKFWSGQAGFDPEGESLADPADPGREMPADRGAFLPDPTTHQTDMSGYYQAPRKPGHARFDTGLFDPTTNSFWHADWQGATRRMYQSSAGRFASDYLQPADTVPGSPQDRASFDRLIYIVVIVPESGGRRHHGRR